MNSGKTYDDHRSDGKHLTSSWNIEDFKICFGPVVEKESVLDYGCGPYA